MDTQNILQLLLTERDRLNSAIHILQGGITTKRRGRPRKDTTPPEWVTSNGQEPVRKKRTFSAAQRKAASLRFKQMWKERKAAAKK
jgi:hypothetical protein